jgi:predicted lysophospholipase L1 biosynthesis ABC-type transport system permease subunit
LLTANALSASTSSARQIALMRFTPGTEHDREVMETERSLTRYCRNIDKSTCVVTNQRPSDIADLARVEKTPLVLALMLGVFGIAVLAQLVVLYCRRRRHDLAVLKTMGALRRQVFAITYWQTSALAGASLVIGLPLGIAVGRWMWDLFAGNVGVATDAAIPNRTILLIVPVLVVVANFVASVPGRRSANLHPAEVLRSE